MKKVLAILLLPVLVAGSAVLVSAAPTSAQTGAITGRVTAPPPPRRRTPPGYRTETRPEQSLPTLAWLVGPVAGAAPGGMSGEVQMMQQDTLFSPAAVFVPVGGSVVFPNGDPFFHNVFSFSGARRFDLGRYARGESKSVQFDEEGLVEVLCEVHDHMQAVIVVTENPFHAVVGEDGTFRIEGVPAGEYTLSIWHPQYGATEERVVVTAGGVAEVDVTLR